MFSNKYNPIIKVTPQSKGKPLTYFRVAGDGFLQVVYGDNKTSSQKDIKEMIIKAFRVIVIRSKIKKIGIKGLVETVPGHESILYKFDPLNIHIHDLISEIEKFEEDTNKIEDYAVETRFFKLPITFEDSEIRRCIEKYVTEIKPGAINCKNGSNLEYVARYNGITIDELKQKFIKNIWLVSMVAFYPGLPFCLPLDPTCALTAPKYNPARTWTPERAVDLADYCSTIFGVPSSGGYQLIGRTVTIFQAEQKHKQYADSPALFKPSDMIQYYQSSEKEINEICMLIKEGRWNYDVNIEKFSLRQWLQFYESKKQEADEFMKKQEQGKKVTPLP